MDKLLFGEETYAVIGAAIEVHRQLGHGFLEAVYLEALKIELETRGVPYSANRILPVYYKGRCLRKEYAVDIICCECIVVELKALDRITGREESQLLNYLKASGLRVGLLINFGSHGKLEWKRFIL